MTTVPGSLRGTPRLLALAGVLLLGLLAAGCGSEGDPAPAGTAELDAQWGPEWQALIAAARREGELVILTGSTRSRDHREIFNAFSHKYGIQVIDTKGSGSHAVTRVLVERSRGMYTADLAMVGPSSMENLRRGGALAPLQPLFMHPEVVDRSHGWRLDQYVWNDGDRKYVAAYTVMINNNLTDLYYNTDNVSAVELEQLNSWQDLLAPRWRGRIAVILDPDQQGKVSTLTRLLDTLGEDWIRRFVLEAKPVLLPGDAYMELADGLARGKYDMAFFVGSADVTLDDMAASGLPVRLLEKQLKEGPAISISGSIAALDRAPHPNAAKLFVNWYLSREGQQAYHDLVDSDFAQPSLRTDVTQGKVRDQRWQQLQSLDLATVPIRADEDWPEKYDEAQAFLQRLSRELGLYGYQADSR